MKGRDLQKGICDLARTLGWAAAHFPSVPVKYPNQAVRWLTPIYADGKGFPDILLTRERTIVVEVKGTGDSLTPEQETWLTRFRLTGIEAFVWGPEHWGEGGVIEVELATRKRVFPAVPDPVISPELFDKAFGGRSS